jgi:hypothetical protein
VVAPEDVITAAKVVSAVAKPTTNVRRSVVRLALVDLYHLGAQWTEKRKNRDELQAPALDKLNDSIGM